MSSNSKNHHIVSKVLQRRFAASDQKIWYSKKDSNGLFAGPALQNIENNRTFNRRHYYSVLQGSKVSDSVEREFYGKLDDYWGKVLPETDAIFAAGRIPLFNGEALSALQTTVFEMAKRTPDFVTNVDDVATGRDYIESILLCGEQILSDGERRRYELELSNEEQLKKYGRDIRVRATLSRSQAVEESLERLQARWVIADRRCSFVLSSRMVYRVGNGGPNGLSNPKAEIWFPISPHRAIVLLRDDTEKVPQLNVISQKKMREINEYAVRNSWALGASSERLLYSLTR